MKDKQEHRDYDPEIRVNWIPGNPENVWEQINKYGTYNIQPTQDAEHPFPTIGQGLGRKSRKDPE